MSYTTKPNNTTLERKEIHLDMIPDKNRLWNQKKCMNKYSKICFYTFTLNLNSIKNGKKNVVKIFM